MNSNTPANSPQPQLQTPPRQAGAGGAGGAASPNTNTNATSPQSATANLNGPNATELAQLQQVLGACLNEDNSVRRAAETQLDRALTSRRDWFIVGLMRLLRTSNSRDVRVLCAIHLRNKLLVGEPTVYEELDQTVCEALKKELLQALTTEQDRKVRHQIGETVSELGRTLLCQEEQWNDLVPFLFTCAKQQAVSSLHPSTPPPTGLHIPSTATDSIVGMCDVITGCRSICVYWHIQYSVRWQNTSPITHSCRALYCRCTEQHSRIHRMMLRPLRSSQRVNRSQIRQMTNRSNHFRCSFRTCSVYWRIS